MNREEELRLAIVVRTIYDRGAPLSLDEISRSSTPCEADMQTRLLEVAGALPFGGLIRSMLLRHESQVAKRENEEIIGVVNEGVAQGLLRIGGDRIESTPLGLAWAEERYEALGSDAINERDIDFIASEVCRSLRRHGTLNLDALKFEAFPELSGLSSDHRFRKAFCRGFAASCESRLASALDRAEANGWTIRNARELSLTPKGASEGAQYCN